MRTSLPRTPPADAAVGGILVARRSRNLAAQFDEIARHFQRDGDRQSLDEERRRETSPEAALAASQALLAAPGLTTTLRDSEQRVEVGSRTFDHERTMESGRQAMARGRDEFRAALASVRRSNVMRDIAAQPSQRAPTPTAESSDSPGAGEARSTTTARDSTPSAGRLTASAPATQLEPATQASPALPGNARTALIAQDEPRITPNASGRGESMTATRGADAATSPNASHARVAATQAMPIPTSSIAPAAGKPEPRASAAPPARGVEASNPVASTRPAPGERIIRTAGAAQPASAEDAEPRENLERIVRVLRMQVAESRGSATIRLDPPELGMLRIQLDLQRDALAVRIETRTDLAQRLLEQSVDELRRELHDAGIRLASIEVRSASLAGELGATAAQRAVAVEPATRQQRSDDAARRKRDDEHADQPASESDSRSRHSPVAEPRINVVV